MHLQFGQLVYSSFCGAGFKSFHSARVPEAVREFFIREIVYPHWDAYNPPGVGYQAAFIYQVTPDDCLFGWMYDDGLDELGRGHVPYFHSYHLSGELRSTDLDRMFIYVQRGPLTQVDRQSCPVTLETLISPDLWNYRPARRGVVIPFEIQEHCHRALKEQQLLALFIPCRVQTDLDLTPGLSDSVLMHSAVTTLATTAFTGHSLSQDSRSLDPQQQVFESLETYLWRATQESVREGATGEALEIAIPQQLLPLNLQQRLYKQIELDSAQEQAKANTGGALAILEPPHSESDSQPELNLLRSRLQQMYTPGKRRPRMISLGMLGVSSVVAGYLYGSGIWQLAAQHVTRLTRSVLTASPRRPSSPVISQERSPRLTTPPSQTITVKPVKPVLSPVVRTQPDSSTVAAPPDEPAISPVPDSPVPMAAETPVSRAAIAPAPRSAPPAIMQPSASPKRRSTTSANSSKPQIPASTSPSSASSSALSSVTPPSSEPATSAPAPVPKSETAASWANSPAPEPQPPATQPAPSDASTPSIPALPPPRSLSEPPPTAAPGAN